MNESAGTETRAAFEAGLLTSGGKHLLPEPYGLQAFALPWGAKLALVDHEAMHETPDRPRGQVEVGTVESFIDYVKMHSSTASTFWVSLETHKVVAVLNDHTPMQDGDPDTEVAGWGDHRAVLQLKPTPEWTFWVGKDSAMVDQQTFAEHLEDGAKEIVEPDSATMLEIAQTFHAKLDVSFRSGLRLSSGETQFLYDEQLQAQAGRKGELKVPSVFKLAISPFEGEEPYAVEARLRFRIRSGSLLIGYKLTRPHEVVRDALQAIATNLAQELANVYMGTPRPPLAVKRVSFHEAA